MSNTFYNLLSRVYHNDEYVLLVNGTESHVELDDIKDGYIILCDTMGLILRDIENEKWLNEEVLVTFDSEGENFDLSVLKRVPFTKQDFA